MFNSILNLLGEEYAALKSNPFFIAALKDACQTTINGQSALLVSPPERLLTSAARICKSFLQYSPNINLTFAGVQMNQCCQNREELISLCDQLISQFSK